MAATPNAVILRLDKINSVITVADNTDYAAQGIDFGSGDTIGGYIKITLNDGTGVSTIYDNPTSSGVPDIDPDVSPDNTIPISLPLNADGTLKTGEYTLIYTIDVHIESVVDDYESSLTQTIIYDYALPEICLSKELKCATSQLASQDITDYGIYLTSITRAHTLYPPAASGKANYTANLSLIVYTNIVTKTWTQECKSTCVFLYEGWFEVYAELAGSNEIVVECATDICNIKCCIDKRVRAYKDAKCSNPAKAQKDYDNYIMPAMLAFNQFLLANYCGNQTGAASKLAEIKAILGCSGECNDCGTDEPTSVIPTSPPQQITYVVDSPDNSIEVTSETVGDVVTYHIEVSATLQDIINNLNPVNVVSTDNSVTITTSIIAGVLTYNLSVGSASSLNSNRYYARLRIYHNPAYATPGQPQYLLETEKLQMTGLALKLPTLFLGPSGPNTLLQAVVIGVSDFFAGAVDPESMYVAQANIMEYGATDVTTIKACEAEILTFDLTQPAFAVRLWNPSKAGTPILFGDLDTTKDLYLQLSIHADDAIVIP